MSIAVRVKNDTLLIKSSERLPKILEAPQVKEIEDSDWKYQMDVTPLTALATGLALKGLDYEISEEDRVILQENVKKAVRPEAKLSPDKRYVDITVPKLASYKSLMTKLGAWPAKSGYRIPISRLMTLEGMNNLLESLPKIKYEAELAEFQNEPIAGFDGSLESLREIPINAINIIAANGQNRNALRKNPKTLEEKFSDHGIKTLHDLLFYFPRRYIDKTNPQSIRYLVEGESATILGQISKVVEMRNNMGIIFTIDTVAGESVRVTFWRQKWLKSKFKEGDEVIITGKLNFYQGYRQLNGTSIDHADEAAVLPIVPIYRQSEAKGITTFLVMAALRELLNRIGKIDLPSYLQKPGRENFGETLEALHFPHSLDYRDEAVEDFAYYELVYMQLILEAEKRELDNVKGIAMPEGSRKLQKTAIENLPFTLTTSQEEAITRLNELLSQDKSNVTLLNAEVGSGKTIVAQLACLRAVDAGYQSVLVAPTEILARQLFETFEEVVEKVNKKGENISIAFLVGGMKAKERRELLSRIKEGEVDIVVGTHAALGSSVKYHNLGLVVVDEQQKFGAEQRSSLLESRSDGKAPDLLMQTATPIPRSIAQIFYGEIEMLLLPDRPPGRLPIITEWVEEDPQEMITEIGNPIWHDVISEAKEGHQTFIITPLVQDSDRVDAASVEKTFETLKTHSLAGLNLGMVHGRMKKEEQEQVMEAFRNGDIDVLVASTVIEVGVDVPNATRMVILSADRLGASSIWQVRGRVGRNNLQSKCYLVSVGSSENSKIRLQSIVDAENGYDVAKADLSVRGEGSIFGTGQSGATSTIVASLAEHGDLIDSAREEAVRILDSSEAGRAFEDAVEKFEIEGKLK